MGGLAKERQFPSFALQLRPSAAEQVNCGRSGRRRGPAAADHLSQRGPGSRALTAKRGLRCRWMPGPDWHTITFSRSPPDQLEALPA